MRGNPELMDVLKIRVRVWLQTIAEQLANVIIAKLLGR
jgi:hypothetical protein